MSVGFETTAPSTCVPLQKEVPENFSIYSCHRICPPVLETILDLGESKVQGFLQPGHVAVITGYGMFESLASKYHIPQVITGFEPLDMLMATYMLCKQMMENPDTITATQAARHLCAYQYFCPQTQGWELKSSAITCPRRQKER